MSKRLAPYGKEHYAGSFATVGTPKATVRLAERMPPREAVAKVGNTKVQNDRTHRLVRRKAKAN